MGAHSRPLVILTGLLLAIAAATFSAPLLRLQPVEAAAQPRSPANGRRIVIKPEEPTFQIFASDPSSKILTCKTAGDKPQLFSQLRWIGPGRYANHEELAKRHRVMEEDGENSNVWSLEFIEPGPEDSGTYTCYGSFQSSDSYNASIEVKVVNPIKLENCPHRQSVVQGSSDNSLSCRITADSPHVTVYKDGRPIDSFDGRYKWDKDAIIINGQAGPQDAGDFMLKIRTEVSGERKVHHIKVDVHSAPVIEYASNVSVAIEDNQARLRCNASGNPKPLVYWLNAQRRNTTTLGGYVNRQEEGVLEIVRVNRLEDDGTFKCIAYNSVGEAEISVRMRVITRPNVQPFLNKTVDEGKQVQFECRSTGEPAPNFTIRREGMNQQPYRAGDGFFLDSRTVKEGGGSQIYVHTLSIVANKSNFGLHYCNATNEAGSAEALGQLTVNYKPDLSQTPQQQYVKLGQKLSVVCHIKSYPPPTVTWWSENTQIVNAEVSTNSLPNQQEHIITMVPPAQTQGFTHPIKCRAENKMGFAEQLIVPRFKTVPGMVATTLVERSPTTVKLLITVPNEGGDTVRYFRYSATGRTLDHTNIFENYRIDRQNVTTMDASPAQTATYVIRNLLPYYSYTLSIRAVNDVGEGDTTEIHVETTKPTRPDPPIILRPGPQVSPYTSTGIPSEYSNGYLLKWSPPDLDNGDRVVKYIISYNKIDADSLNIPSDIGEQMIVEQMNERPMHARLGPLEVNRRYKIQLKARNNYGDSDSASLIIYTTADRPSMPEFEGLTLAWLIEPTTPTLIALLTVASMLLVIIDLIFCSYYQFGVTYILRYWCCPPKASSVISETFTRSST